jgi:hypothetical protein
MDKVCMEFKNVIPTSNKTYQNTVMKIILLNYI